MPYTAGRTSTVTPQVIYNSKGTIKTVDCDPLKPSANSIGSATYTSFQCSDSDLRYTRMAGTYTLTFKAGTQSIASQVFVFTTPLPTITDTVFATITANSYVTKPNATFTQSQPTGTTTVTQTAAQAAAPIVTETVSATDLSTPPPSSTSTVTQYSTTQTIEVSADAVASSTRTITEYSGTEIQTDYYSTQTEVIATVTESATYCPQSPSASLSLSSASMTASESLSSSYSVSGDTSATVSTSDQSTSSWTSSETVSSSISSDYTAPTTTVPTSASTYGTAYTTSSSAVVSDPSTYTCPDQDGALFQGPNGKIMQVQCYEDHQASQIGIDWVESFAVCLAHCDALSACKAIAYTGQAGPGFCYMKGGIGASAHSDNVWGAVEVVGSGSIASVSSTTTSVSLSVVDGGASSSTISATPLACPSSDGSTFIASNGALYTVECFIDRYGGDIVGSVKDTLSLEECINYCETLPTCVDVSYTGGAGSGTCWVKSVAGDKHTNGGVWGAKKIQNTGDTIALSTATASATSATTTTSTATNGPAPITSSPALADPNLCPAGAAQLSTLSCPSADSTCYTSTTGDVYSIACGTDYYGGDLFMQWTGSLNKCLEACSSTAGCIDVSWVPSNPVSNSPCWMKNTLTGGVKTDGIWAAKLVAKADISPTFDSSAPLPKDKRDESHEDLIASMKKRQKAMTTFLPIVQNRKRKDGPSSSGPDYTYPPQPHITSIQTTTSTVTGTVTSGTTTVTSNYLATSTTTLTPSPLPASTYRTTVTATQTLEAGIATTTITTEAYLTRTVTPTSGMATVTVYGVQSLRSEIDSLETRTISTYTYTETVSNCPSIETRSTETSLFLTELP
jgi:hypothetical protein